MSRVKLIELRKEYLIIEQTSPDDLSKEITKYLKTGLWLLVGGPYGFYNSQDDMEVHCQAMVKICLDRGPKNVKKIQLKEIKKEPA